MFTMQSLEIALDIQASHRQRATGWRLHHRGPAEGSSKREPMMAPIVVLPQRVPVTSVLDVA
ncbi:MAG TPA: hypothetical protein VID93_10120 [Acidimicrobiales bacterium]|jgi:hypothetical protein